MVEQRNIVVLGASAAGLQIAHYILQILLPALKARDTTKYHLYLLNPTSDYYFRIGSPRVAAAASRMPAEKILFDIPKAFEKYDKADYTFVEAAATGLDTERRVVVYKKSGGNAEEQLVYHALIIATGSRTDYEAFNIRTSNQAVRDAIKTSNAKVESAKDIVIVGGGPTAVEFAGEIAEHRNGKTGWFRNPERKVNITLITAQKQLLPQLRPAIGKAAERKLADLGVDVLYNTRVTGAEEQKSGRTVVTLAKDEKLDADLFVPAYGVQPNSSWLPDYLLDNKKYLVNNHGTLRVDAAGPLVYAIGDVASYSRNTVWDILTALPVLYVNLKRDLLSYNAASPNQKPRGQDRIFTLDLRESMIVPIGSQGGVGAIMGWRVPSWFVWMLKSRDFLVSMSAGPTVNGSKTKEVPWTKEETVI